MNETTKRIIIAAVAAAVLIGMWIERFVLVAPSLWGGDTLPGGLAEVLITSGLLSRFLLCYAAFLHRFPTLAVADPRLQKHD